MFVFSKLFWTLVQPGNSLRLLLCAGLVSAAFGRRRLGLALAGGAAAALLAVAVLPIGTWALAPLEDRFVKPPALPDRVDGIIVLGGHFEPRLSMLRGEVAVNGKMERMLVFADLARRHPEATLVFSGGSGEVFAQDDKEATVARELNARHGVPEALGTAER